MTVEELIRLLQEQPAASQVLLVADEDYGFPGGVHFCATADDAPYGKGWHPSEDPRDWKSFVVIKG